MPDENIRDLERAAINASPEVVAWLRALARQGSLPIVPVTPLPTDTLVRVNPMDVMVEVDLPLYVEHDHERNIYKLRVNVDSMMNLVLGRLGSGLNDSREVIEGIRRSARANPTIAEELRAVLREFSER